MWVCNRCFVYNSSLNEQCLNCLIKTGILISRVRAFEDKGFDNKLVAWQLEDLESASLRILKKEKNMATLTVEEIENNPNMNAKEKKFAKFFAGEKTLVSQMDDAGLRAHIEELQDIAFEARARLFASDDEFRERGAKKKRDKGFSTSVQTDDFTSEAINNIAERQKKMSKVDKEIERLVSMGIDRKDAENMYRATTMKAIQTQGVAAVVNDLGGVNAIVNSIVNSSPEEKKNFSNPFASSKTIEPINQDIQTVAQVTAIITEVKIEEEKKTFNPFAKKE